VAQTAEAEPWRGLRDQNDLPLREIVERWGGCVGTQGGGESEKSSRGIFALRRELNLTR
jgi:hypothetical protein